MENGKPVDPPARKAAAVAIIKNPFVDIFEENLDPLIEIGDRLGEELSRRALRSLQIDPDKVESFGKGAVVGLRGELEHAAAILHPKLGHAVRRDRRWRKDDDAFGQEDGGCRYGVGCAGSLQRSCTGSLSF